MKRPMLKILLAIGSLVLVVVVGVCGWLFVYTGDLPDFDHLSQFAPDSPTVVSDPCLASASDLNLVLVVVVGVCGWLFVYTGDLPDFDHLSQFAPDSPTVVSDPCLASA